MVKELSRLPIAKYAGPDDGQAVGPIVEQRGRGADEVDHYAVLQLYESCLRNKNPPNKGVVTTCSIVPAATTEQLLT